MSATLAPVTFNFDHEAHVYTVDGQPVPHITGMLQQVGLVDDLWFTEESCERGIAVHDLTAAYDLGALDPRSLVSRYRPYVVAYVGAMQLLKPTHLAIEEPEVHPQIMFGGRPDRVSKVQRVTSVIELKSGPPAKRVKFAGHWTTSHQVQTALQAILVAWRYRLEPEMFGRYAVYPKQSQRFSIETHRERSDFHCAREVLKECCHVV